MQRQLMLSTQRKEGFTAAAICNYISACNKPFDWLIKLFYICINHYGVFVQSFLIWEHNLFLSFALIDRKFTRNKNVLITNKFNMQYMNINKV